MTVNGFSQGVADQLVLARLTGMRRRFRLQRAVQRMLNPRRIIASALAVSFFVGYLLCGIFVFSAREAADPERLRLWLSGGMVIYAIYHCMRCAWKEQLVDLQLTPAEKLWLRGAPIRRSTLATYQVGNLILPSLLKTSLLTVILAWDVQHVELLVIGVFCSLLLMETARLCIASWSLGLSERQRRMFRIGTTAVAAAAALYVLSHLFRQTPSGSPTAMYVLGGMQAVGELAACNTVQWLSLPWIAPAQLAVTASYQPMTIYHLLATISVIPIALASLLKIDAWSHQKRQQIEQRRLQSGNVRQQGIPVANAESVIRRGRGRWLHRIAPESMQDAAAVASRQWCTVRHYYRTIAFSFLVPTLLCLSPLMTGQSMEQWLYIVGGIAMCTMLLAPPALKIDFRRDLRRMLLLRSLPVTPFSMVVGQLLLPVAITIAYQWLTLIIAAVVIEQPLENLLLWAGMLNALAVFTFAAENSLFLTYPHHEHSEGIGMMIRAKLTFLGKAAVMLLALALLVGWSMLCRNAPESISGVAFVGGAIAMAWMVAAAALTAATICWRRFEIATDTPPE